MKAQIWILALFITLLITGCAARHEIITFTGYNPPTVMLICDIQFIFSRQSKGVKPSIKNQDPKNSVMVFFWDNTEREPLFTYTGNKSFDPEENLLPFGHLISIQAYKGKSLPDYEFCGEHQLEFRKGNPKRGKG